MSMLPRDDFRSRLGMWLFLFTEFMLFGALFLLYAGYRTLHPAEFHAAGRELNVVIGVANTIVLLTGSLSAASAVASMKRGLERRAFVLCLATAVLGAVFLVDKGIEWGEEIRRGIYPSGPSLVSRPPGEVLFFGLYYLMTGLHGLHVLAGTVLLLVTSLLIRRGRVRPDRSVLLENSGLYWHLVDIIWIFLLPLFYLAA